MEQKAPCTNKWAGFDSQHWHQLFFIMHLKMNRKMKWQSFFTMLILFSTCNNGKEDTLTVEGEAIKFTDVTWEVQDEN